MSRHRSPAAAAYAQTDPANPTKYGNYHKADRPRDGDDIRYIVIHDTEETYDRAIARFQDPHTGVSTHYLIRSLARTGTGGTTSTCWARRCTGRRRTVRLCWPRASPARRC
ncbi:MAG: hypothetical protein DLM61_03130 [Pseudonocardiales bacterium]|nr:MAG: hypothetical protein DLM61_03130 [Pseudonocardiales bacterium]